MEAGAFDGATDSTSLHFEIAHQWSGLLIEPVARFFHLVVVIWGLNLAHIEMGHSSFLYHEDWVGVKALPPAQKAGPSSRFFAKIAEKGRRAWSANTCLSTTTRPQTVNWSDEVNELTMQVSWWCGGSIEMKIFLSSFEQLLSSWKWGVDSTLLKSEWVQTFWRIISN